MLAQIVLSKMVHSAKFQSIDFFRIFVDSLYWCFVEETRRMHATNRFFFSAIRFFLPREEIDDDSYPYFSSHLVDKSQVGVLRSCSFFVE